MSRALLIVILILLLLFGIPFVGAGLLLLLTIFGPSFDEYGQINECIGCRGCNMQNRKDCRYNPEYWRGPEYIGPSRKELQKLKKKDRT